MGNFPYLAPKLQAERIIISGNFPVAKKVNSIATAPN